MCEWNHFHHVKPNSSSLQWPFSISNHNDRSLQCDKCLHWRQPPRTTTCSLLRWWSAHWPKSLTYLILSAWMCVCGPALWLCARIKPMEQLCELSWVRALHVKLSPRQPPHTHPLSAPAPLPFCCHYTSCGHKDITAPGRVKLKVPFLPIFRTLPFIPYWRWALRSSPTSVCCFYLQKWNSGRITDTRVSW